MVQDTARLPLTPTNIGGAVTVPNQGKKGHRKKKNEEHHLWGKKTPPSIFSKHGSISRIRIGDRVIIEQFVLHGDRQGGGVF